MTFFGRGFELAVTFTHARVRVQNEGWNNSKSSATFKYRSRSAKMSFRRAEKADWFVFSLLLNFMTLYK